MSNYAKFDFGTIKARIKDGTYPSLVGANRAIGKTQGLSDADKATLKALAAKHFGAAAPVEKPSKKAAKKAAKKEHAPKAAKKASKKVAKKTAKRAKKAAAKPAAAKAAAEPAPAAVEQAAAPKRRGRRPAVASEAPAALVDMVGELPSLSTLGPRETAALIGNVIGTVDQMMKSIEHSNLILPKSEAEEANKTAVRVMERAVRVLDQYVVSPLLETNVHAPSPAKSAKATSTKPAKAKGGGRAAKEAQQEAASADAEETEHLERLPDEEIELTEEERAQLALAQELADENAQAIAANGKLAHS